MSRTHKATYCMIPFIWHSEKRQIIEIKLSVIGVADGGRRLTTKRPKDNGNICYLDCGSGYMTVSFVKIHRTWTHIFFLTPSFEERFVHINNPVLSFFPPGSFQPVCPVGKSKVLSGCTQPNFSQSGCLFAGPELPAPKHMLATACPCCSSPSDFPSSDFPPQPSPLTSSPCVSFSSVLRIHSVLPSFLLFLQGPILAQWQWIAWR